MKKVIWIVATSAALSAGAGVPVKWTVETSRADERVIEVYHGESLEMEVTFKSYGKVLELPTNEVAATFWQTNGMDTAYWRTNNVEVLATNGIMKTVFGPEQDVGAKTLRGFIGIAGQIYRAAFVLRFKDAPGYNPAIVEWPYRRLDFNVIEVLNPPYYLKAETDAKTNEIVRALLEGDMVVKYADAVNYAEQATYATEAETAKWAESSTWGDFAMDAQWGWALADGYWIDEEHMFKGEDRSARTIFDQIDAAAETNEMQQAQIEGMPTTISNVVTKSYVEDLGIKPQEPSYQWARPDEWTIDVTIDRNEQQAATTTYSEETDTAGRVWSNETYIAEFGMAAQCSAVLLDESSMNTPEIESWSALPPGGTIDASGHFTAATSGLYRVSATATDGTKHYADVAISAERTVTNSNVRTYVADDENIAVIRSRFNDNSLQQLQNASFVSSNQYGSTWYTIYDIEVPRWVEKGGWVFHPFAIAPRILATCAHGVWEGREGLYEAHTFTNADGVTTYTLRCNQHWVILEDWAKDNGFTAAEAATVSDLALNFATYEPRNAEDTDTGVDSSILPMFLTPEKFELYLKGDAAGVLGWHFGQDHAEPFPISFRSKNFQNWGWPEAWGAKLRRDIYEQLKLMDFMNYPIHGGDSGQPIYLHDASTGRDIVVAHHTTVMGCRADYITGYKIIKAFAEANGQQLLEWTDGN